MTTVDTAVAVVGNGPVGQSAALLLARWRIPVILLDQRSHREPVGSKAIVQQRDVLDIWESVGAGRRIADEGLTWTVARTFYRDRELFSYTFLDAGRSPFPPFVNVSQSRTEEILDERIAAEPLIDVRWNLRVTGLVQDASGVALTCRGEDELTIRAQYVLACAGGRGDDIRQLLGVTFDGFSFDDRFLICDIQTDLPGWADERRFYFDPPWNPGRQVLIHPCPQSTFRIDWQVPADFDDDSAGRDARVRAIIGDRPYTLAWSSVYRFQSRLVDRMRVGRVLLAGDVAHLVSPFGARGLNSGVADAENAAWKLAFVLAGWSSEGLLESYHFERHAAAVENLDVTTATMRFLVPGNDAEREHRLSTLEAAAADPAARAGVDSGRLSEPFWYVDSPLTTLDASRPFAGRPARGTIPPPGPGLLVPDVPIVVDGKVSRLRAAARDGFLLLAADDVDVAAVAAAARRATAAPVRTLRMSDIDPSGGVAEALGAKPTEVWLLRPDAHIAAVVARPRPEDVSAAIRKALGQPES